MTDRELLELAAMAAGIELDHEGTAEVDGEFAVTKKMMAWKPLTDDGDALRLATACCISFGIGADTGRMHVAWFIGSMLNTLDMPEDHPMMCPASQTEWLRRAIVRAAAEIGRTLQAAKATGRAANTKATGGAA